jgi:hypothetical protein
MNLDLIINIPVIRKYCIISFLKIVLIRKWRFYTKIKIKLSP